MSAEIGGWIFEQKVAVQVRRELAQVACFFKDPSLEAVRKGRWRSKLGVGVAIGLGIERTQNESPAEGAVAFSTCLWGWIGSMLCPGPFWGIFILFQQTKAVGENCSDVAAFPPLRLCASSPDPDPETFSCAPPIGFSNSLRLGLPDCLFHMCVCLRG